VTLVFDSELGDKPGTHVLAIGIGRYPHLLGGDKRLTAKPMGLKQLESPPVSVKALTDWFLASLHAPENPGFINATVPLGSLRVLASATHTVTIDAPHGQVNLEPATKSNIDDAFTAWLDAVKCNDANIGVFYFCGHGVMVSNHYLLAEDFGATAQAWSRAFDISATLRAVEREVKGTLYFFIDACREISRDLASSVGANPMALIPADLTKPVSRKSSVCISAAGEGQRAFAPRGGQVSQFTQALLRSASGFAGVRTAGHPAWEVDGETLATAIRIILMHRWESTGSAIDALQLCEQKIAGESVPLLRRPQPPKVEVEINYLPESLRMNYELYLHPQRYSQSPPQRIAQTRQDRCLAAEVPMGIYTVGAIDPDGRLPADIRPDEDLRPPHYRLALGTRP
jgi:hypothetical protein